mgnify:CR=1 FL=1|jgi:hypothetical protein
MKVENERNQQPCAHKRWYADPSDSSIFKRIALKIKGWLACGSKQSCVINTISETPTQPKLSTFEHIIKIDHFLKDLGMTGSVINSGDLKKFRIETTKIPHGLIKDNVYSLAIKQDSKKLSVILND